MWKKTVRQPEKRLPTEKVIENFFKCFIIYFSFASQLWTQYAIFNFVDR